MDYKVIKNFIPKNHFIPIYEYLTTSRSPMEWKYNEDVGNEGDNSTFLFFKGIYPFEEEHIKDGHFKIIVPLLFYSNIYTPTRIRINCFPKTPTPVKTEPHNDQEYPHRVLLYSINTNNGCTVLDPEGENIKIPSVANQALFFDGSIKHQAITQTDTNIRVNININYR
jgi:hypothetical protein